MGDRPPIADQISVVIPTVGRPILRGCLGSIERGTTWPAEVIVVDQGGHSDVSRWVEDVRRGGLRVRHLPSSQRGIAAATNRGLERVRTRYAATTHDDCRVGSRWVETLTARLPSHDGAIVTGRVLPEGDGIVLTIITSEEPAIYRRPMIDRDVLFPPNMAFSMDVLERVGFLDEHPSLWSAGEDNEWAYRALRRGVPIVYDPAIAVSHLAWQPREMLPRLCERYARGQGAFYGKYLRRGDLFIARRVARDVIRAPWLLLRGLLTGNGDLIAMGRGEVFGLVPGILAGMGNRSSRTDTEGWVR